MCIVYEFVVLTNFGKISAISNVNVEDNDIHDAEYFTILHTYIQSLITICHNVTVVRLAINHKVNLLSHSCLIMQIYSSIQVG